MIKCTLCSHIHNALGGVCPHCGSPFGQVPIVEDTPVTKASAEKLSKKAADDQAAAQEQDTPNA